MKKTNNKTKSNVTPVAVIGIGCLFPGSKDKKGYWQDITTGRDMVREVPPSHFLIDHYFDPDPLVPDKTYCRKGAFLDPIEFDPMAFGIPPKNLAATDTSQLLSLLVAQQVLNDAFPEQLKNMDRSRIGVIMGVAAGLELLGEMANRLVKPNWVKGMREAGLPEDEVEDICKRIMATHAPWNESTFPGLLGNVVTGRISNYFDLGGINCTSDAACASSFSALSQGINELYTETSDVVLVGGADTNNDSFLFVSFSKTPALSPTHDCRPFSEKADGMVLGEGVGMLAIKRLDDAERDGDRIYAVIRGVGASSDGKGSSIYAPCSQGQAHALRRCYEAASYSPETVELVEGHGTATKPGDKAEIEALKTVFGDETLRQNKQWCALGSVKSQIGHTKSAAATAGIIKAVMGLHHKVLPPTIKVEQPNPSMKIKESPFYVNTECRPWVRDDAHPRRASVSSFGFGGTNFHVTVEEYKGPGKAAWRLRNVPSELVVLGAENAKGLEDLCRDMAKDLDTKGVLTYLARTSQESFDSSCSARLAVIATDEKDLETKLNYVAKTLSEKPNSGFSLPNGLFCTVEKADPGDIAFLFPGQGTSGCLDMGKDLAMQFSDAMDVWDFSASFDRKRGSKEPLHKVVYPMPVFNEEDKKAQNNKLALTEWAQPAVMTTSMSMSAILKGLGIQPDCVGGHSLGEISALYDAGVLDMESLFNVCFKRGELMARARAGENHGTMTAALCDPGKAQDILDSVGNAIIIANHNSPSQIVFSGPVPDMEVVEEALTKEKIKFRRLPVSAAFHSSIMNEACAPFLAYIKGLDFKKAKMPVYSNISGKPHLNEPDKIRDALAKQIISPVQFVKEIDEMYAAGVRTFIEVGSGCVLTNCVAKILENKPHAAINMDTKKEHGVTSLWKALARLIIAGVTPDFSYLWKDYEPVNDPRKKEKPKFSVTLSGTNYGKPYPPPGGIKDYPKPNPPRPQIVPQIINKEPEPLKAESNMTPNTMTAEPVIQKSASTRVNENPSSRVPTALRTQTIHPQPSVIESMPPAPLSGSTYRRDNNTWIETYQNIQQQTTDAHSAYLKVMAESHLSFLKAAESSNIAFSALLTGQSAVSGSVDSDIQTLSTHANITTPEPAVIAPSISEYKPAATPTIQSAPKPEAQPAPEPIASAPVIAEQTPDFSVPPNSPNIDFTEMLLDVVADKTGYPKEILNVDMDLELDLGIDSIKRVEIFSAINEENPWLPEVDPAIMADIKTLGDVIAFIEQ
ncbi:MAG: acyltransferase domain-containing protein, partial [Desulfobacteraceae bacterium]|nr:acyltransferase domain-containing protein [Desulfobacteraceae bacterium]